MYANQDILARDVKREVLAELRQGNHNYTHNPHYGDQMLWRSYSPQATNQTYQTVKDSVKNEILSEIQTQQADRAARMYGIDRSLSDQNIQQMVAARYRTIDDIKSDIKKELLALQSIDAIRSKDPYISQIAEILTEESRRQGIPLTQVLGSLDQKGAWGGGIMKKLMDMLNKGQRKGFLCGAGSAILFNFLWPLAKSNMKSVAVRSMEEGMSVMDKAKSFMGSQSPQPPTMDFTNISPVPSTDGIEPPDGNNPMNPMQ